MIDLNEHKVYIDSLKMEMVPLSIALKALEEAYEVSTKYEDELEDALSQLHKAIGNITSND